MAKNDNKSNQKEFKVIDCNECTLWSRQVCVDDNGEPVKREAALAEPFWYYDSCKKNWGLPGSAHIYAVTATSKCKFFVQKKS